MSVTFGEAAGLYLVAHTGAAPLTVLDRDDLEAAGRSTIGDIGECRQAALAKRHRTCAPPRQATVSG